METLPDIQTIVWDLQLKFGASCLDDEAECRAVAEYILEEMRAVYENGQDALESAEAEGYENGRETGYTLGRNQGYKIGRADGYEKGYDDGEKASNWSKQT